MGHLWPAQERREMFFVGRTSASSRISRVRTRSENNFLKKTFARPELFRAAQGGGDARTCHFSRNLNMEFSTYAGRESVPCQSISVSNGQPRARERAASRCAHASRSRVPSECSRARRRSAAAIGRAARPALAVPQPSRAPCRRPTPKSSTPIGLGELWRQVERRASAASAADGEPHLKDACRCAHASRRWWPAPGGSAPSPAVARGEEQAARGRSPSVGAAHVDP